MKRGKGGGKNREHPGAAGVERDDVLTRPSRLTMACNKDTDQHDRATHRCPIMGPCGVKDPGVFVGFSLPDDTNRTIRRV